MIDYFPSVVWQGRHYDVLSPRHPQRSRASFIIRFDIQYIGRQRRHDPVPEPWPDRTAFLLPARAVLYAVIGSRSEPTQDVRTVRTTSTGEVPIAVRAALLRCSTRVM